MGKNANQKSTPSTLIDFQVQVQVSSIHCKSCYNGEVFCVLNTV